MRAMILAITILGGALHLNAQINTRVVGQLNEPVSNNAVAGGEFNNQSYIYTFGGIDSTKKYSGIHLRSYRYNTATNQAERIPDLPDTLGKVAAAASRMGDIIYIAGGYHVFANGTERSSNKMHRYSISQNQFLPDGKNIPVATDDHVQVVWRDSLIYLITGWSTSGNIPLVQIYDPALDTWSAGTTVPNNDHYKSFGASGIVWNDTIFYFGGASGQAGFPIQNELRKGVIDPSDPTQITWTYMIPDSTIVTYRSACMLAWHDGVQWIGGSKVTYNYNGIAYNGSGGVPPANQIITFEAQGESLRVDNSYTLPMDLRGIAGPMDGGKYYLLGGMEENQQVSNQVILLEEASFGFNDFQQPEESLKVFPQPAGEVITVRLPEPETGPFSVKVFSLSGQLIKEFEEGRSEFQVGTSTLNSGTYVLLVASELNSYHHIFRVE